MASTELRRRLGELAQEFVDGVVKAIQTFPIQEVAGVMDGGDVRSSARRLAGGALAAVAGRSGRRGGPRGRVARVGTAVRAERLGGARGRRPRRLVRRASNEIQNLRDSILSALKSAPGPIGAAEIARQIGGVKTSSLAFPMTQLRRQGLVQKDGERTQAVYTLGSGRKAGAGRRAAKKKS